MLDEITKNAFGHGALVGARDYFAGLKDHAGQATEFVKMRSPRSNALLAIFASGELSSKNFVDTVKRVSAASVCDYANSLEGVESQGQGIALHPHCSPSG